MALTPIDIDRLEALAKKEFLQSKEQYVLDGKCVSLEDYKDKTGEIRGARRVLKMLREQSKKDEDDEN